MHVAEQPEKSKVAGVLALKRINSGERVTEIAYSRDTLSVSDIDLFRKLVAQCCNDVTVVDSGFALHIKDAHVNKGVGLAKVAEYSTFPSKNLQRSAMEKMT